MTTTAEIFARHIDQTPITAYVAGSGWYDAGKFLQPVWAQRNGKNYATGYVYHTHAHSAVIERRDATLARAMETGLDAAAAEDSRLLKHIR